MPRKILQLAADLRRAGFRIDKNRGKGSHDVWVHPTGVEVVVAGNAGDDAHFYQEKEVRAAIREAKRREEQQP